MLCGDFKLAIFSTWFYLRMNIELANAEDLEIWAKVLNAGQKLSHWLPIHEHKCTIIIVSVLFFKFYISLEKQS